MGQVNDVVCSPCSWGKRKRIYREEGGAEGKEEAGGCNDCNLFAEQVP